MRRLIKADLKRILRRKSIWIFFAAVCLITVWDVVVNIDGAPDRDFVFAFAAADNSGFLGLLIGFVLIVRIYADEFKSMTFITVIGRGISRNKLIIAKFLDTLFVVVQMYVLYGLFILLLKTAVGVTFTPLETQYIWLRCISDVFCTIAGVSIAAAVFFVTENAALGVFSYVAAEIIIPVALYYVSFIPAVSKWGIEKMYFSWAASSIVTDFMIGSSAAGTVRFILLAVFYIGGAIAAAIVLFRKKELDF